MIRICPERDAVCPHGMECFYAKDSYSCRKGWSLDPEPPATGQKLRKAKPHPHSKGKHVTDKTKKQLFLEVDSLREALALMVIGMERAKEMGRVGENNVLIARGLLDGLLTNYLHLPALKEEDFSRARSSVNAMDPQGHGGTPPQ